MSDLRTGSRAVVETRLAHDVHRRATSLLADAAARPSIPTTALAELRDFLVGTLHHHHQSEDTQLWPLITSAAPQTSAALAELSGEHDQLDGALETLDDVALEDRAALEGSAVAVRDLVHEHLAHEEPLLLAALRDSVSDEAWADFSRQVIATAPTAGAHLMFGFFDELGTPEEVEPILGDLPGPARELLPALRRHAHATLDALRTTT